MEKSLCSSSKTFCAIPFTTLFMGATGENRLCCVAKDPIIDGRSQRFYPQDLQKDVWQSDYYKKIRKKMLTGQEVEECRQCYDIEDRGGHSDRQNINSVVEQQIGKKLDFNIETGTQFNSPIDLDLRPSNLCNLKCRMCFSDNSSLIGKEIKDNPQILEIDNCLPSVELVDWFSHSRMKEQIKEYMPNVWRLKLLGGETTIVKEVHNLLQWCIDQGLHKQITLDITTNLTNTNETFFSLICQFKSVYLYVSVDGIGQVNNYIRFPSRWRLIEKSVHRYIHTPLQIGQTFEIRFQATASIYSVLYFPELISWVYNLEDPYKKLCKNRIMFCPVNYPKYQRVALLPWQTKRQLIASLKMAIRKNNLDEKFCAESRLSVVMQELKQTSFFLRNNKKTFIKSTLLYDKIRKQDIRQSLPEIYKCFKKSFDKGLQDLL